MEKHHFYKFQTKKGWITKFNLSEKSLKKIIEELNPLNCYISVNKYLSFKEHNKTYSYQNNPYKKYLLIDIDGQNFNSFEETKNYFIEINKFLKEKKVHIEERICTNSTIGGFQILISPCCRNKVLYFIFDQKIFAKIDSTVIFDDKRVRRLPLSWNSNHNSFSHYVDEKAKDLNISEFKDNKPFIEDNTPNLLWDRAGSTSTMEKQPFNTHPMSYHLPAVNDEVTAGFNIQHVKRDGTAEGSQLSPLHNHSLGMSQIMQNNNQRLEPVLAGKPTEAELLSQDYLEADDNEAVNAFTPHQHNGSIIGQEEDLLPILQVSSSVYGTKGLNIPVFKMVTSIKCLKRIQKFYSLGDLYVMKHKLGFDAFGLKCLDSRRMEKVLKKYGKGLLFFQKFKHQWLYLGKITNYLSSEANGNYSRPHSIFFKLDYPNLAGTKLKVYQAVMQKNKLNDN